MDFELTEDQVALAEATRAFCEGRFPMKTLRELDGGISRSLWKELADTGVFALRLPESEGGAGLGMAEAALVFEELGRWLVPGPLVGSHLAAGVVDGAAEGQRVVGLTDGGFVEYPSALDVLLRVRPDGEMETVELPRAEEGPGSFDPLTPLIRIGEPAKISGGAVVQRARLLTAALLLGIARRSVESAIVYAGERRQFDRPIGSFQAVKHLLADSYARSEAACAAVYAAAVISDESDRGERSGRGDAESRRATFSAKLLASEAAVANARACIQVYGGMGFTWEVDAHLYLKRAQILAAQWGSPEECAEELADVR